MKRFLNITFLLLIITDKLLSQPPCVNKNDFTFERSVCNPLTLSYLTNSIGYNSIKWDLGNGNTITGLNNPMTTYNNTGNYTIRMIQNYGSCIDTVIKQISLDFQVDNQLSQTNDTLICFGASVQLLASPSSSYCWSPASNLNNPALTNPIATPTQNITYYYVSEFRGSNLILNSDFSQGNVGFSSDYLYSPSTGVPEGVYNVGSNIVSWHPTMKPCTDHTSGIGNMMMVNGAVIPDVNVWKETVIVQPNTNYEFSTWLEHITSVNPAILQFSINGINIGNIFQANSTSCVWDRFFTTWNSGNNTIAVISIVNKNTINTGNDFALDDIFFGPIIFKRDSVNIKIRQPFNPSISPSTNGCVNKPIQLLASGGDIYLWQTSNTLSSTNIPNPIAYPKTTTSYLVKVTDTICNNTANLSTTISIKPFNPTISPPINTCSNKPVQLNASGGNLFSWQPSNSLSDFNISNPIASPKTNVTYIVKITDTLCNDTATLSINIAVKPFNPNINPTLTTCANKPIQLNATGGDIFLWQSSNTLSNTNIPNPTATPKNSTIYKVIIIDTGCNYVDTLTTNVNVNPLPIIKATKSNDIDCVTRQSQFIATGGTIYSWTPSNSLNNPNSSNPIATPSITTNYLLRGEDLNGCVNTDSLVLNVSNANSNQFLMANAFTPNNDRLNDCFGIKGWGNILELDFSVYNRWGEIIFHSNQSGDCWDGKYKGVDQNAGAYIYIIKAKTACVDSILRKGTFVLIR